MKTQGGGGNTGFPSLLRHWAQLGRHICQLDVPAALYLQENFLVLTSVEWFPVHPYVISRNMSLENFQESYRESNLKPSFLWRCASSNCAVSRITT